VLQEIGVEERGGDVRFKTGSGNVAVSCTGNKKNMQTARPLLQEQFGHCELGYRADTTFHRTYFYNFCEFADSVLKRRFKLLFLT